MSFLQETSSKSEFKAVTNMLRVIGEKIKTTVGKEDADSPSKPDSSFKDQD